MPLRAATWDENLTHAAPHLQGSKDLMLTNMRSFAARLRTWTFMPLRTSTRSMASRQAHGRRRMTSLLLADSGTP